MTDRESRSPHPADPCAEREEADPPTDPEAEREACEARLERLRCELEMRRLCREDTERSEAGKLARERETRREEREREERLAHERTVERWRQEEAQRRKDRRDRWKAFWENRRKRRAALGGVSGTLNVLLALGLPPLVALLIYAVASDGTGEILAIGALTSASAFAVGALLGFLFGIPRSIAASGKAGEAEPADGAATAAPASSQRFAANTNLEQISDWLTKILVGVGLVQIHQVSSAVTDLADGLAPGLGEEGFSVAVALLVSFSITGFVSAYLFTRLRLQGAFELASLVKQAVEERADTETSAIALVQQQLTPEAQKPTLDEIVQALKAATPGIRQQAFYLARRQRMEAIAAGRDGASENPEEAKKEKQELAERTLPIFEALMACDLERIYHFRLRAELGNARLQLVPPDYASAKADFEEAIKLRPPDQVVRTPQYELNRAFCTIELDGSHRGDNPTPSSHEVRASVEADLTAVINLIQLNQVSAAKRGAITGWLQANAKVDDDLKPRLEALLKRLEEADGA